MTNFDEQALTWDNDPRRTERAKVITAEIQKAIPDLVKMNGFEYGCGTGLLSFELQPQLKRITLGDSSQGMLAKVNQKIKSAQITNMTPILSGLSKENLIDIGKFDIIFTL